jgi:anti-anti-sigma factor
MDSFGGDSGRSLMPVHDLESRVNKLAKALSPYSQHLRLALRYIQPDAASALTKSRLVLEKLVVRVYSAEMGQEPRKPLLGDMLVDNQFTRKIERRILSRMNAIRDMGNLGPHGEVVEPSDAARVLDDLCEVLEWYLGRYAVEDSGNAAAEVAPEASLPKTKDTADTPDAWIEVSQVNDVWHIRIVRQPGNETEIKELEQELCSTVENNACRKVVISLSGITYWASITYTPLLKVFRYLRDHNGQLRLCDVNPLVHELFRCHRIDRVLEIVDNPEAAFHDW